MKTAAYFSDFTGSVKQERELAERIRQAAGAECLVAVMSGDFLQNGFPAGVSRESRARRAVDIGVAAVLEMSLYTSLSSLGIYAFAAARILDKLESVDVLVLETEEASMEQLMEITFLLIANTREFQKSVTRYKEKGLPFYEAQAKAIGETVEGGERIMMSWYNIFAVECLKALRLMYSSLSCICIPREHALAEKTGTEACRAKEIAISDSRKLSELLRYQLYFSEPHLSDIYGGYEELTNQILEHRESFEEFGAFCGQIAGNDKDLFDVRKYFLRLLCGITKSTVSIWRMYDFAPYCVVYAGNGQTLERLEKIGKLPLLGKVPAGESGVEEAFDKRESRQWLERAEKEAWQWPGQAEREAWQWLERAEKLRKLDRSKRELLELEERAGNIYRLL